MFGNSFWLQVSSDLANLHGTPTHAFCHIFLQTSSSWLNVCGDGKSYSKNLNVLSVCSLVISTMILSTNCIPQIVLTCICENLRSSSTAKWSIIGIKSVICSTLVHFYQECYFCWSFSCGFLVV